MEDAIPRSDSDYEQDAEGEVRYVYYGETKRNRMLAIVLTERIGKLRVITAYELDAGQKLAGASTYPHGAAEGRG